MIERSGLGAHTEVLWGTARGKYPHGNSLLVRGRTETLLIDPSIAVAEAAAADLPRIDRVVNSHCHEDHIAGNGRFPDVPWHFPEADLLGIQSLDGLMAIYGFSGEVDTSWRRVVVEQFHFTPRVEALGYRDGEVFDLGGGVRVRAIHAPGHTRGHSMLLVEPDAVLYLGDLDLSSFGPYYGDAWSSLEDFERTLALARDIEARWYATFHHIGVLAGRAAFVERLDRYAAVIADRERRLLAYLAEPHSLGEIAAHRFVYRPQDPVPFAEPVERRSMGQHVERLVRAGRVREVEPGRYQRA
ncbi:MAG TPA: MBL fold metallo-hydrolase [Candidatus Limnocylindria bacterium]|nr:MBL fold metallo-hydrolase [Candidatus Limnocylindria bacterium]